MENISVKKVISFNEPHKDKISCLKFHPQNESLLASSSADKTFKLWRVNVQTSELREEAMFKFHAYGINQIKWNTDGNLIASAGNDFLINLTDVTNQKLVRNFRMDSNVTCLDINAYSNLILCGTFDKQIALWDVRTKNVIYQILSHSEPITSANFSPDSTVCVTGSYDGFIRFWDVFKGNCLKTISMEKSPPINEINFLSNNSYVLVSSLNNQIQVLDSINEQEVTKFTGHKNTKYLLDMKIMTLPDEEVLLISGSEDNKIYFWDVEDGSICKSFSIEEGKQDDLALNCLSLSASQKILATSSFKPNLADNRIDFSCIINGKD